MSKPLRSSWLDRLFWNVHSFTWDERLRREGNPELIRSRVRWLATYRRAEDERVLDVGCGTGNYTVALASDGFRAVGVDFAKRMLRLAEAKAANLPAGSASFQEADFDATLPFPDASFDHAVCIAALQCARDPRHLLAELRRLLRAQGMLLIVAVGGYPRRRGKRPALETTVPKRAFWFVKRLAKRRHRWPLYRSEDVGRFLGDAGFEVVGEQRAGDSVDVMARRKD